MNLSDLSRVRFAVAEESPETVGPGDIYIFKFQIIKRLFFVRSDELNSDLSPPIVESFYSMTPPSVTYFHLKNVILQYFQEKYRVSFNKNLFVL